MKICPKCNCGNKDNAVNCIDCGETINNAKVLDEFQITNDYIEREEKRQFRKLIIKIVSAILIVLVYILLSIKAASKNNSFEVTMGAVIIPIIGCFSIFYPKAMFILSHFFTIENIDEVEVSDFYKLSCMASGVILIVVGAFLLFMISVQ